MSGRSERFYAERLDESLRIAILAHTQKCEPCKGSVHCDLCGGLGVVVPSPRSLDVMCEMMMACLHVAHEALHDGRRELLYATLDWAARYIDCTSLLNIDMGAARDSLLADAKHGADMINDALSRPIDLKSVDSLRFPTKEQPKE